MNDEEFLIDDASIFGQKDLTDRERYLCESFTDN
jgi:hypothetical protein